MLSHTLIVQPPDWSQPFHVFVDASDVAIGSALMHMTPPNWYRPIYYASRRLSAAERNYLTMEREALGMIYNITKLLHYLLGAKIHIPCRSLGPFILGNKAVDDQKTGSMDVTLTRV